MSQTVYILVLTDLNERGSTILGVYSSLELAEKNRTRFANDYSYTEYYQWKNSKYGWKEYMMLDIDCAGIDDEPEYSHSSWDGNTEEETSESEENSESEKDADE